jgi:hypothetical protein
VKEQRPWSTKIPDIRVCRSLTILLGKLGIKSLRYAHPWSHIGNDSSAYYDRIIYGWSFKETTDYVESKYNYIKESK